jgi:hypothetical protein
VNAEAENIVQQLGAAEKALRKAKLFLEQVRKLGVEAEQEVVSHRNHVHELKDRLTALVGKENTP